MRLRHRTMQVLIAAKISAMQCIITCRVTIRHQIGLDSLLVVNGELRMLSIVGKKRTHSRIVFNKASIGVCGESPEIARIRRLHGDKDSKSYHEGVTTEFHLACW
jgi:hypothetical protein